MRQEIAAPDRTVCQHTGAVARRCPVPEGMSCNCTGACLPRPVVGPMPSILNVGGEIDRLRAELAKAIEDRDGYKVELDNAMQRNIDLASLVKSYAVSEGHWHAARDEAVEKYDEARDQRDEARVRIDELKDDLDEARTARTWGES